MRTTLTIDDDVLSAAKDRARADGQTTGQVLSDMARRGFSNAGKSERKKDKEVEDAGLARFGVHTFPSRGGIVTNDQINRLREDLGV